jgi:hypothetical protein
MKLPTVALFVQLAVTAVAAATTRGAATAAAAAAADTAADTSTSTSTARRTTMETPSGDAAACLASESCASSFCGHYGDRQCQRGECVQLHNAPYYVCDCEFGYIPTADPDVCIAGQAFDLEGDADLCKENANCEPASTCNDVMGYVECICHDEMEYDPVTATQTAKVVMQSVDCSTGRGYDSDGGGGDGGDPYDSYDPCQSNYCDPRAACQRSDRDSTLAECQCPQVAGYMPDQLVLLQGFACPISSNIGGTNVDENGDWNAANNDADDDMYSTTYGSDMDPCTPNHCDEQAVCMSSPDMGGGAECHCPGGQILRPYYDCPESGTGMGEHTGSGGGTGSDYAYAYGSSLTCADEPCHYSTPCIQYSPTDPPKCQCPNGLLVDAGKDCPTDYLEHAEAAYSSCSTPDICPPTSTCQGGGEQVVCSCNGGTDLEFHKVLAAGRGVCQDLCQLPHGMTYEDDERVNPCDYSAVCEMVQGWAQCSCGGGRSVLHHEKC